MFDFFRKHTRVLQFVLVLLIFPSFVFFGIQGYSRFSEGHQAPIAKVDGQPITQAEWDAAHRTQVERMRRQMPNIDASFLDTPELKQQTLDSLVREHVLQVAADKEHLVTSDERLARLFASDPQLAFLRNPDGSVNKDLLGAQGMSSEQFAARLKQDYSMQQVLAGVTTSALVPASAASAALEALFQQREVQVQRFEPKDYAAKINPSDAEIDAYYKAPAHAAQFTAPEQASIQYLVLDLDSIGKTISVPEDDLRKYYTENAARYTAPDERRASHILIKADKNAPPAERAKAKAKAESLLAEARKSPEAFAELAKKNSDDPGSAAKGGDLDFFGRGAMVKPFEDAAFALKPGETSGVVESDFGYHIIRVTGTRGGDAKPFESVRAEIEAEARKQAAQKKFAELAEQFSDLVFQQSDSLQPAADKLKLSVQTATVQRQPSPEASGPLASTKLLAAVFGNEALKNKHNTEAVETGANQLVSAHVLQYVPAHLKPLAEVHDQVRAAIVQAQAVDQARKDGEARLAAVRKDAAVAATGEISTVSRAAPKGLPQPLIDAVLKADAVKLPQWLGVDLGGDGYAVVKLSKVLPRDTQVLDAQRGQTQYGQAFASAESQAYYAALKARYKVEIMPKALEAASAPEGASAPAP